MAEVVVTAAFKRRYKPLAKRHRSLEQDVLGLIASLEVEPVQGTPLGKDCYKIRLAVSSKGGGKSGRCKDHHVCAPVEGKGLPADDLRQGRPGEFERQGAISLGAQHRVMHP